MTPYTVAWLTFLATFCNALPLLTLIVVLNFIKMKKKLKLNDLSVKSFVTEADAANLKGGTGDTLYSCMAFITCAIPFCYLNSNNAGCDTKPVDTLTFAIRTP